MLDGIHLRRSIRFAIGIGQNRAKWQNRAKYRAKSIGLRYRAKYRHYNIIPQNGRIILQIDRQRIKLPLSVLCSTQQRNNAKRKFQMVTTMVRASIENGKLYAVVCEYNNGKESYRYTVTDIDNSGDAFGVRYETTGDKETLCRLFADRHDGKPKTVRVVANRYATEQQTKAVAFVLAHHHAAHCLNNGKIRIGIDSIQFDDNGLRYPFTALESVDTDKKSLRVALGY